MKRYWKVLSSIWLTDWRNPLWLPYRKVIKHGREQGSDCMGWWRVLVMELEKCVVGIGRYIYLYVSCYIMVHVSWYSKRTNTLTFFELEQDSLYIHICTDTELKLKEKPSFSHFPPMALHSHRHPSSCTAASEPKAKCNLPTAALFCL